MNNFKNGDIIQIDSGTNEIISLAKVISYKIAESLLHLHKYVIQPKKKHTYIQLEKTVTINIAVDRVIKKK